MLIPTYFECVTALAFEVFARERVEFGVIEVGLGGRLDATNIITPVVSIITRIDFDHENFLGHSLQRNCRRESRDSEVWRAGGERPATAGSCGKFCGSARRNCIARSWKLPKAFRIERETMEGGYVRAQVTELVDW